MPFEDAIGATSHLRSSLARLRLRSGWGPREYECSPRVYSEVEVDLEGSFQAEANRTLSAVCLFALSQVISHWVNQSLNTAINYYNR